MPGMALPSISARTRALAALCMGAAKGAVVMLFMWSMDRNLPPELRHSHRERRGIRGGLIPLRSQATVSHRGLPWRWGLHALDDPRIIASQPDIIAGASHRSEDAVAGPCEAWRHGRGETRTRGDRRDDISHRRSRQTDQAGTGSLATASMRLAKASTQLVRNAFAVGSTNVPVASNSSGFQTK